MKNAPLPLKLIINFVAYIGYTLLLSIIFSFSFPLVLNMLGKELYNSTDPIFVKIQITIAVIVFVITLLFRKYFYISLSKDNYINDEKEKIEVKKDDIKINKVEKEIKKEDWLKFWDDLEKKEEKFVKKENDYVFKMDDTEEDDFKIYTDKEIKR